MEQHRPAPGDHLVHYIPTGFIDLINIDIKIIVDNITGSGNQERSGYQQVYVLRVSGPAPPPHNKRVTGSGQ